MLETRFRCCCESKCMLWSIAHHLKHNSRVSDTGIVQPCLSNLLRLQFASILRLQHLTRARTTFHYVTCDAVPASLCMTHDPSCCFHASSKTPGMALDMLGPQVAHQCRLCSSGVQLQPCR